MLRDIDLNEISDGKLYGNNDMTKADCGGCKGCCDCCKGMGTSIVLDPLDVHRLCVYLNRTFYELMEDAIELNVVDGVILPNLKMTDKDDACVFLNDKGRCSIHSHRPGICRLFPLGRFYENHSFQYFLQVHECTKKDRTKVKVRKWIGIPDIKSYEKYILDWHDYLKELTGQILSPGGKQDIKEIGMHVLQSFYVQPYDMEKDFYEQFYERLQMSTAR
ncbi:MAG: YkgJ family cysteine cluster protein [Dorea sp.]|jgi:Fe-S-cluster containining protein|nr:YkgJ family cysteine cluster protein [Dorea sp.]